METSKISLNKPISSLKQLDISGITVNDDTMEIYVLNNGTQGVSEGQKITFFRSVSTPGNPLNVAQASVEVLSVKPGIITTEKIPVIEYNIAYPYEIEVSGETYTYTCLVSDGTEIPVFLQDIAASNNGIDVRIKTVYNNITYYTSDIFILTSANTIGTFEDLSSTIRTEYCTGSYVDETTTCFLPTGFRTDRILLNIPLNTITENYTFSFSQNPFFYYDSSSSACTLWDERYWENGQEDGSTVSIWKDSGYWQVPLILSQNSDYDTLMREQTIVDIYAKNVRDKVDADIINMDKVKYSPAVYVHEKADASETSYLLSDKMIFNLHFRERVKSGDTYAEGWYVDDEGGWNTTEPDVSDPMECLGFTASDVKSRANRISKSFLRLSFYDSNDPTEQNLLAYTTIHFDMNELVQKTIKTKDFSGVTCTMTAYNPLLYPDKSGEGYNVYMFEQDTPEKTRVPGISGQPFTDFYKVAYMKVEFNHAGYGKTIPMVMETSSLTVDNFFENLFIETRLFKMQDGYIYYFSNNSNIGDRVILDDKSEETSITFSLFEPKLEEGNNG